MSYPNDLKDEEWEIVKEYFGSKKKGRRIKVDRRAIVNAIFYQSRTGCQWRYLPREYPNYKTVNEYYNKWNRSGLWQKINEDLLRIRNAVKKKVNVHSASVQDRDGAKDSLVKAKDKYPSIERFFADGGYSGNLQNWCFLNTKSLLSVVKRKAEKFEILPI
ncbi:hypothetical protein PV328_012462, partial [Microctonus aethiopoides]